METFTNFILRPWKKSDINNLVKYANNKNISDNLTNAFPHPYAIADGDKFINSQLKSNQTKNFAIEINGEACGSIGIFQQSDIHKKKCRNRLLTC